MHTEHERINVAIRAGDIYDAYVDFDRLPRGPAAPTACCRAMSDAVPPLS
ncbi:hypothetical protein POF50_004435 [Streptomyces sp. SL13]|uniref:Uncharacterized protein n=1 Tax=Streptantibioticus silvisoli TaxID=2705255 RepID=A0AA90H4E7_9ACTN|nr:hypothetical protein [Streptantibioticus silvisoli]MDI5968600.1 hypothetical protein [Streptantibioticus silvisoli]